MPDYILRIDNPLSESLVLYDFCTYTNAYTYFSGAKFYTALISLSIAFLRSVVRFSLIFPSSLLVAFLSLTLTDLTPRTSFYDSCLIISLRCCELLSLSYAPLTSLGFHLAFNCMAFTRLHYSTFTRLPLFSFSINTFS